MQPNAAKTRHFEELNTTDGYMDQDMCRHAVLVRYAQLRRTVRRSMPGPCTSLFPTERLITNGTGEGRRRKGRTTVAGGSARKLCKAADGQENRTQKRQAWARVKMVATTTDGDVLINGVDIELGGVFSRLELEDGSSREWPRGEMAMVAREARRFLHWWREDAHIMHLMHQGEEGEDDVRLDEAVHAARRRVKRGRNPQMWKERKNFRRRAMNEPKNRRRGRRAGGCHAAVLWLYFAGRCKTNEMHNQPSCEELQEEKRKDRMSRSACVIDSTPMRQMPPCNVTSGSSIRFLSFIGACALLFGMAETFGRLSNSEGSCNVPGQDGAPRSHPRCRRRLAWSPGLESASPSSPAGNAHNTLHVYARPTSGPLSLRAASRSASRSVSRRFTGILAPVLELPIPSGVLRAYVLPRLRRSRMNYRAGCTAQCELFWMFKHRSRIRSRASGFKALQIMALAGSMTTDLIERGFRQQKRAWNPPLNSPDVVPETLGFRWVLVSSLSRLPAVEHEISAFEMKRGIPRIRRSRVRTLRPNIPGASFKDDWRAQYIQHPNSPWSRDSASSSRFTPIIPITVDKKAVVKYQSSYLLSLDGDTDLLSPGLHEARQSFESTLLHFHHLAAPSTGISSATVCLAAQVSQMRRCGAP
ncbi:hypothetical protein B0H13DRAFT_1876193 [Mycena leptocephala]|nr:hypothetical protein B0H13DRAFT_1876193 [Mycena leptocephala]